MKTNFVLELIFYKINFRFAYFSVIISLLNYIFHAILFAFFVMALNGILTDFSFTL